MTNQNLLKEYIHSENLIGLDSVLKYQLKIDGAVASTWGITSLGPVGFFVGLIVGALFWF
ncbi:MAG: hypothetical protein CMQ36_08630 [Gammaproteobacteria bacterium]|jgi:hypothetical protein|nr:hypothetical protein [Gammaproteobacteria bacterium]MCH2352345.1 hypothetical protein [Pseudomonadales bacterium]HAO56276.1 hypothetical protein [Gammaproteobacteria bacterium]